LLDGDFIQVKIQKKKKMDFYPKLVEQRQLKMPKHPTLKAVSVNKLIHEYGATYFREALARFVAATRFPNLSANQLEYEATGVLLPTRSFPVFHTLKFIDQQLGSTIDAAHAKPSKMDRQRRPVPSRFDTVLLKIGNGDNVQGLLIYIYIINC